MSVKYRSVGVHVSEFEGTKETKSRNYTISWLGNVFKNMKNVDKSQCWFYVSVDILAKQRTDVNY